jgi:hypothetical protein
VKRGAALGLSVGKEKANERSSAPAISSALAAAPLRAARVCSLALPHSALILAWSLFSSSRAVFFLSSMLSPLGLLGLLSALLGFGALALLGLGFLIAPNEGSVTWGISPPSESLRARSSALVRRQARRGDVGSQ